LVPERLEDMRGNGRRTLILADIFESKCQTGIFAFNDADFAKGSLSDHSEQTKVIKVYCVLGEYREDKRNNRRMVELPSSVKTTGLPWEFPISSSPD
jgi:hypothetical protein